MGLQSGVIGPEPPPGPRWPTDPDLTPMRVLGIETSCDETGVAVYDTALGGAAALRARRCGGCSLELDHSELAAIAKEPSDTVVRCEECSRILVRTHESGL